MAWNHPQKGVNYHFSSPEFNKRYVVGKLSILEAKICSFSRISQKLKNYISFKFLQENLEKFRSTELYDAPLEGSTSFLYRSSLGRTSLESCRLAELKYAIFSGTGRKTKKIWCSKLFLSTVFKLLEGSTFLFRYSSMTRTPLESSQLGELKYTISAG